MGASSVSSLWRDGLCFVVAMRGSAVKGEERLSSLLNCFLVGAGTRRWVSLRASSGHRTLPWSALAARCARERLVGGVGASTSPLLGHPLAPVADVSAHRFRWALAVLDGSAEQVGLRLRGTRALLTRSAPTCDTHVRAASRVRAAARAPALPQAVVRAGCPGSLGSIQRPDPSWCQGQGQWIHHAQSSYHAP